MWASPVALIRSLSPPGDTIDPALIDSTTNRTTRTPRATRTGFTTSRGAAAVAAAAAATEEAAARARGPSYGTTRPTADRTL